MVKKSPLLFSTSRFDLDKNPNMTVDAVIDYFSSDNENGLAK